ncbi:MAG: hypothetical protein CML56_00065 [Rhodobacteraceae bacterium]|nr:hypothetical protein [Paracoccaceae bacterium]|tara:strand:- start:62 stop:355 length:294 start_codon:yes stop_codon:yes gene_type:complete
MSKEKTITEEQAHTNPLLAMAVNPDSELKDYLVEYVGKKLDNEEVTVNMIAEVLATDFPEFAFAYAEENFLRGYQLGLDDAEKLFTKTPETADGTAK